MRVLTLTAAIAVSATLLTAPAFALPIPIQGSSGGSFSNLSSCDNSGSSKDCRIVDTSNGANTQVQWGSTSYTSDFVNPSTLTSVDVTIDKLTPANDVVIARLDWYNSATKAQSNLDSFGVNWLLTVTFTKPNSSGDTESFNLSITNPLNPPGDNITGLTLGDLSNLTFSLIDVTVSDLKYSVGPNSGLSTLSVNNGNGNWYNPENNLATLLITADFTGYSGGGPTRPVTAPGAVLLLGGGLAALSAWRWRASRR